MAKKVYKTIGSVVKGKDGKPDYIKISQDVQLIAGQFITLESAASKKASVEKAVAEGKLSEEKAANAMAAIEKIPAFVRFSLVLASEE
jgi:hypothetical protein